MHFAKKSQFLIDRFSWFFRLTYKIGGKYLYQKKNRGHRASKIFKFKNSYSNDHLPYPVSPSILLQLGLALDPRRANLRAQQGCAETIGANVLKFVNAIRWLSISTKVTYIPSVWSYSVINLRVRKRTISAENKDRQTKQNEEINKQVISRQFRS